MVVCRDNGDSAGAAGTHCPRYALRRTVKVTPRLAWRVARVRLLSLRTCTGGAWAWRSLRCEARGRRGITPLDWSSVFAANAP